MATETFAASSDFHGDRHDPVAGRVQDVRGGLQADAPWFLGDLWDFRALRVGADRDEKLAVDEGRL
jgi:hypothetical protein